MCMPARHPEPAGAISQGPACAQLLAALPGTDRRVRSVHPTAGPNRGNARCFSLVLCSWHHALGPTCALSASRRLSPPPSLVFVILPDFGTSSTRRTVPGCCRALARWSTLARRTGEIKPKTTDLPTAALLPSLPSLPSCPLAPTCTLYSAGAQARRWHGPAPDHQAIRPIRGTTPLLLRHPCLPPCLPQYCRPSATPAARFAELARRSAATDQLACSQPLPSLQLHRCPRVRTVPYSMLSTQ